MTERWGWPQFISNSPPTWCTIFTHCWEDMLRFLAFTVMVVAGLNHLPSIPVSPCDSQRTCWHLRLDHEFAQWMTLTFNCYSYEGWLFYLGYHISFKYYRRHENYISFSAALRDGEQCAQILLKKKIKQLVTNSWANDHQAPLLTPLQWGSLSCCWRAIAKDPQGTQQTKSPLLRETCSWDS